MSIPNLPTDNLYKFIAIGGIVLFIGGIWLNRSAISDRNDRSVESARKSQKIMQDIIEYRENNPEHAQRVTAYLEGKPMPLNDRERMARFHDALKETARDDQDAKVFILLYDIFIWENEIEQIDDEMYTLINISNSMIILGILTAITGFGLWYYKCQRHLDKIVVNQAKGNEK